MRQAARLWLIVVPAALLVGGIAFALGLTSDHSSTTPSPAVLVVELVVGWSFIAAGLVARTRRPENRTGLLLIAVGFAWLLNGLGYANSSFVWTLGYALSAIWAAVFVHALLAYPSGLITSSRQRALVVFGYALAASANIAAGLFDPNPDSCDDCPTNALLVTDNQTAADTILLIVQILGAAFLIWVAVEVIQRWRGSTKAGRRLLGPVLLVGGISVALLGASLGLQTFSQVAADVTSGLAAVAFLTVPFLFLWGILRSRLARGDVGRLLYDRRGPGTAEETQENLRQALGDPTLELVYWLPDREHYVDVSGQATELPLDSPARAVTPIAYDDRPVGALIHDPVLRQEAELVDVVVGALRVGIERDRLQAELRAKIDELQSERNFVRDVVNAAPSYFVVTDEEGLLVRFNDTLLAATGVRDDDDTRGRPWWELFALPDEAEGLRDWFLAARQKNDPPALEVRMSGSGGELVTGWSLGRVRETGRLRYLLTGLDLTERVRQERELATSERRSRALLEAIPDAMIRFRRDGTVVDWYADPQHINFAPPEGFIGSNLFTTVDSDRVEQIARAASRALESGELQTIEYDIDIHGDVRNREGRIVASGEDEVFLIIRDITDRKQAADALETSERRSRALLDGIPDNIFRLARDDHRFLDARWVGPSRLPIPADQVVGSTLSEIGLPPAVTEILVTAAERAFATGSVQEVGYELDVAGEAQYLEARVVPSGEAEYYVVVRDATERKRAQQALQTSERRSRALLEGVPDNIYRVAREGHRFLDIRWADPTRLPVPQERFIGGTVHDLGLPGDLADRFIELAERAFSTGGVQALEYEVPQADGEPIHLEARVVPSGDTEYFVIVRDVSDRKRAELALKAQADFLSEMGDATPSYLAIVAPDGTMSRQPINRPLREFTGLDIAEAAHRVFWEVISAPEDAAEAERVIREVTATGQAISTESRWLARGGERRLIAWTCTPLPDMEPGVSYHLVSGVDVTERARQEQEQAALRRVAVAVASERRTEQVFDLVTEEVGRLLGAHSANVVRYEPDGKAAVILGRWSEPGVYAEKVGVSVPMQDGPVHIVLKTGLPVRFDLDENTSPTPLVDRLRAQGASSVVAAPIVVSGKLWGAVSVSLTEGHVFPPGSEERIGEFTRLVSLALANEETREQLAASRARIVEAGDAERRRLERNLHDGAQQRLVSLSLSLRLAQARLESDPGGAHDLLGAAGAELALALEELRELARGIHPAVLTDRGLGPALESLADRAPLPVDLVAIPEDRLPGPVEAAAFYVVAEALTNVAKYADASSVSVSVARENGQAVVEVADDGKGGADPTRGSGLRGLVDRVEALEGRLAVESPPGAGTRVRAEIPL